MTSVPILESPLNNLAKAAQVLDGHWCTGELLEGNHVEPGAPADPLDRGDKFCAVGALAWIISPEIMHVHSEPKYIGDGEVEWFYMNDDAYKVVRNSKEGEVLALVIAEHLVETGKIKIDDSLDKPYYDSWDNDDNAFPSVESYVDEIGVDDVIFNFNDEQTSQEPVLEMIRRAAERFDSEN